MAEAKWYLAKDEKAVGPFTLAELRRMAAAGSVGRDDLVCPEDGSAWVAATAVPGLFSPPQPPPLPAAPAATAGKGAKCKGCGTLNVVSDGYGRFSHENCRGCGRPLRDTNPDEFLDAEMERVYENSVTYPPATAALCALVASFVLHCAGLLPKAQNGKTYPLAFFVACGLLYLGLRAALARYIRLTGSWEGLSIRSELAGRMRGRAWDEVAARYARSRGAGTATSQSAAVRSPWIKVAVAAVLAVGGFFLYEAEFSQYALGRKAGIRHVREMSQKGPFIRAGMNAANAIDLIPNNPDASADWNAGFRAGFKEELERMYPEVKGR